MSFNRRAKPRRIGAESASEDEATTTSSPAAVVIKKPSTKPAKSKVRKPITIDSGSEEETVVRKPVPKSKTASASSTPKPKAAKLSFGTAEEDGETETFAMKKSNLSRKAMERNAARVVGMEVRTAEHVSYSAEALAALRQEQVAAPIQEGEGLAGDDIDMLEGATIVSADEEENNGQLISTNDDSVPQIMDPAYVRVMKERRAARAAAAKHDSTAEDFISLTANGDNQLVKSSKKSKKESRLVKDDFNDMEEIENYAEDAGALLANPGSKSARREEERQRKAQIAEMIAEASDISEDEEWQKEQIRKGVFTEAGPGIDGELEALAKNPPVAQPLPDVGEVVRRLEGMLKAMKLRKKQTEMKVEELLREKKEIAEREGMVQSRLKEAGEMYEKLRAEVGGAGEGVTPVDRGLESFGNTPITGMAE
ncbi:nineteen complex-related protein 2-domain-containing protein [Pyronema omphalodes]|nr:nineteen complex-related protein 2-domain-containing protein [Pyronema omphalodes]